MNEQEALKVAAEQLAKAMNAIMKSSAPEALERQQEYQTLAEAYRIVESMRYRLATQKRLW